MAIVTITADNFESEVLNADKTVLVDFWATWCGPCQMMMPIIESVSEEIPDVKICKVNIDDFPEIATKYRVSAIPTFMVFKDGQPVQTNVGGMSKNELMDMVK